MRIILYCVHTYMPAGMYDIYVQYLLYISRYNYSTGGTGTRHTGILLYWRTLSLIIHTLYLINIIRNKCFFLYLFTACAGLFCCSLLDENMTYKNKRTMPAKAASRSARPLLNFIKLIMTDY